MADGSFQTAFLHGRWHHSSDRLYSPAPAAADAAGGGDAVMHATIIHIVVGPDICLHPSHTLRTIPPSPSPTST